MEVVDDDAVGADVVADHYLASSEHDHLDCTLDEDEDGGCTCPVVDDDDEDDTLDDHLCQDKATLLHHEEVGDEDDGHGVEADCHRAAQILHWEACHHDNHPMASRACVLDVDDHLVVGTAMMMMMTGHHSG
jgi:hypothetical protein